MAGEAGDRVVGDEIGNLLRRLRPLGAVPVGGPVDRAQERARRDGRVGGAQEAPPDAAGNERADAALVAIALGDDARAQPRRQRVHFEMRRRSLDVVQQAEDVRGGDVAEAAGERAGAAPRARERLEQPIERSVLAEKEQLLFAAEVVIEVAGREVGGDGDVAHAGRGEPARAEHARRRAHDRDAPGVGALRTAVRKVNHRSILDGIG